MTYSMIEHASPVFVVDAEDPEHLMTEPGEQPEPGRRGIALGFYDHFGVIVTGTLAELAKWAQRVTDEIAAAQGEGYEEHHLERETTVTVHGMTAAQYEGLHDRLSLPRGYMGKWRGPVDERRNISFSADEWGCGGVDNFAEALAYLRECKADFTVWDYCAVRHTPRS